MNAAQRAIAADPKVKSEIDAAHAEHVKAALADPSHPDHADVSSREKARLEAEAEAKK